VGDSVSKKTDYLVAGRRGVETAKAQKLATPILTRRSSTRWCERSGQTSEAR
jgi:NAD-dependent DNA ligase